MIKCKFHIIFFRDNIKSGKQKSILKNLFEFVPESSQIRLVIRSGIGRKILETLKDGLFLVSETVFGPAPSAALHQPLVPTDPGEAKQDFLHLRADWRSRLEPVKAAWCDGMTETDHLHAALVRSLHVYEALGSLVIVDTGR